MLWLSPALIINTFVWPQWDCWVLAPALWTMWAILERRWVLAGAFFAVGTMLKGQTLFLLPWLLGFVLLYPYKPCRLHRIGTWPAATTALSWVIRTTKRLTRLAVGFALITFIVTLPFTLRHNLYWLNIYTQQVAMVQPMSVGFWNVPLVLVEHYGWGHGNLIWSPHFLGIHASLTISHWLDLAAAIWFIILALLSRRAFSSPWLLLAPGTAFAIFVALVPGMHERYGLWAAALLVPAVVLNPMAAFAWFIFTAMAFLDPFNTCLY